MRYSINGQLSPNEVTTDPDPIINRYNETEIQNSIVPVEVNGHWANVRF